MKCGSRGKITDHTIYTKLSLRLPR